MGCVSSKKARSDSSPAFGDVSPVSAITGRSTRSGRVPSCPLAAYGPPEKVKENSDKEKDLEENGKSGKKKGQDSEDYWEKLKAVKRGSSRKKPAISLKLGRLTECEQAAAGWPPWLSAVAGEAIDGWLPLRSDSYERLEKIGQGTYSNVYKARDLNTGSMVAIKKVRFDNFQPESVRFMAREILILRRLDHPNIMKLDGIITSRLSCSIYLVFPYMEHDLAGLLSSPDIKFTESQIKCYMRQLLSGVEHCHSHGLLHRDIKSSNILVNNEGILKIADFGLANFMRPETEQPLTSRVVTLWYRPPELLLGATDYGEAVDLWSVGCVFAEFFIGKPLLKGRTEVEQLHKVFKLCGTPSEDYWKKSRLPLATMFKPQQSYVSTLRERCKEFPTSAVGLIETFLSIEPYKRGTAASALESEYFKTLPYACDPLSLPQYPPNKEIDAKIREDARRKAAPRGDAGSRKPRRIRKSLQDSSDFCKVVPSEDAEANVQADNKNHGVNTHVHRRRTLKQSYDTKSDLSQASQTTQGSQASTTRSVPVQVTASSGFAWAKKGKQRDVFTRLYSQHTPRSQIYHQSDSSRKPQAHGSYDEHEDGDDSSGGVCGVEATKPAKPKERGQLRRPDSFDSSVEMYEHAELAEEYRRKANGKIGYSGPLHHHLQRNGSKQYDHPRHRSRFYKDF